MYVKHFAKWLARGKKTNELLAHSLTFKTWLYYKFIKYTLITALDKRIEQERTYFTTKHVIMILMIIMAMPIKYWLITTCKALYYFFIYISQ